MLAQVWERHQCFIFQLYVFCTWIPARKPALESFRVLLSLWESGVEKNVVFLKLQLFAAANHMGKKAHVDGMSEVDDTCLFRCPDKEQSTACWNQNRP